jgi:hypothetical protein
MMLLPSTSISPGTQATVDVDQQHSSGNSRFSQGAADELQKTHHQLQNTRTEIAFCNSPNEFCSSSLRTCAGKTNRLHFHHRASPPERSHAIKMRSPTQPKGALMKTMMLCFAVVFATGTVYATVPSTNHAAAYTTLTSTRTASVSMAPMSAARESREYQRIRGTYALDSGGTLTISRDGRRMFVELTNQPRIEVQFNAEGTLVSLDGRAMFRFREAPNGLIAQVVMTQSAGAATAMKTAP